ncbi:MAG TPA: hypothetical protein VIY08_08870 [Candidatus Nitrosocosmicus sp.]
MIKCVTSPHHTFHHYSGGHYQGFQLENRTNIVPPVKTKSNSI